MGSITSKVSFANDEPAGPVLEDPRSPTVQIFRTPLYGKITKNVDLQSYYPRSLTQDFEQPTASNESIEKDNLTKNIGKATQLLETNYPESPSTGIERTPFVDTNMNHSNNDNVEQMSEESDDTLIKVLQSTNAELLQTKSLVKNTQIFLIYEDKTVNNLTEIPKKSKSANNNGYNATMIPKRASRIPRLKSLSKQTRVVLNGNNVSQNMSKGTVISGDRENNPAHSHRNRCDKD